MNIDVSVDTYAWVDNGMFFLQRMERDRRFQGTPYLRHLLESDELFPEASLSVSVD